MGGGPMAMMKKGETTRFQRHIEKTDRLSRSIQAFDPGYMAYCHRIHYIFHCWPQDPGKSHDEIV